MVYGDPELRRLTMWLISNICCNGDAEIEAVVSSGLVSNITMALRDNTVSVRYEALWALANLLKQREQITDLLSKYEIEMQMLENLRQPN